MSEEKRCVLCGKPIDPRTDRVHYATGACRECNEDVVGRTHDKAIKPPREK